MSRIWILTKTMTKSSGEAQLSAKSKKINYIVYPILFLYLGGIVGFFSYQLINLLANMNQAGLSIYLLFTLITIYLLLMSLFLVPGIYYFSKDIQRYLVLPIKPREFMIARFLTTLFMLYITLALIYVPFGAAYMYRIGFSLNFLVLYIFAGIILPIIPLALTLTLITLVFKFLPLFRSKNLFTYLTSGLILAISLYFSAVTSSTYDPETIIELIMSQESNSLLSAISTLFVHLPYLVKAIVENNYLALIIAFLISLALAFVGIALVQSMYLKSALSIQEEKASSKKLEDRDITKRSKRTNLTWALIKVDFKNIMRTPIMAMNYLMILIILPVMMLVPLFTGDFDLNLNEIVGVVHQVLDLFTVSDLVMLLTSGAFILSFLFGSFGTIASTSITREGKMMEHYKIMPMNLITLVNAKLILATLVTGTLPFLLILILGIILKIKFILVIVMLAASILGIIASMIINIFLDVYKPKLDWTTEQEAIKQNLLSMIPMFSILIFGFIIVMLSLNGDTVQILFLASFVVILISGFLYYLIGKMCKKRLPQYIA